MGHSLTRASMRRRARLWTVLAALVALGASSLSCGGGGTIFQEEPDRFAGPSRTAMSPNFLDPYGHYLFVANSQGGTISVLNAQDYRVLSAHTPDVDDYDVIRVGRAPFDLALNPTGDQLFVTDAWEDNVRVVSGWAGRRPDVFDVKVVFDENGNKFLRYEIFVRELETVVRAGEIAIQSYPGPDGFDVPVFITDPDNERVVVLDSESGREIDEVPLPERPTHIAITPRGEWVFVTGESGILYTIDTTPIGLDLSQSVELGGVPGRMTTSVDGDELYVLNEDPPRLDVLALNPARLRDVDVRLQTTPNGMARSSRGAWVYIAGDDGYVYTYDTGSRRLCNSWGGRVFFADEWPYSAPKLERIDVKDCRVLTENWELIYRQQDDEWTVRGSLSGLQLGRAKSDQYYETDDGALGFYIRDDDAHSSDEDAFYFETNVGIEPIRVGLVPDALAVTPYFLDPFYDVVFVTNAGTDNISLFFSEENQRLGAVN